MRKRLGQAHGIDHMLPDRPPGAMVVYCPVCPEPGFNVEQGWESIPPTLKYVICVSLTYLCIQAFFTDIPVKRAIQLTEIFNPPR